MSGVTCTVTWMVDLGAGIWQELTEWERRAFEKALEQGHETYRYTQLFKSGIWANDDANYTYTIDLIHHTQTNEDTGTVRALSRFVTYTRSPR